MKKYSIVYTDIATQSIESYIHNITERSGSRNISSKWALSVRHKVRSLQYFPFRHGLAEENEFRDYEIQQIIIGKYVALYYVDEEAKKVHVLTIRHGSQLPIPDELPEMPPE
ncbi:MAG: hypothetical protein COA78_34720 [Blastopirellula sp.]|nr:MAG: hypothetical protein COA78_34720 [Blastopirellula sp.]